MIEFDFKNLGKIKYFLGAEIAHSPKGTNMSQQKYILGLLAETGFSYCQPTQTPIDSHQSLV